MVLQGHLVGLAVLDVPLPVKEPVGDLVLAGVLRERDVSQFTGSILCGQIHQPGYRS